MKNSIYRIGLLTLALFMFLSSPTAKAEGSESPTKGIPPCVVEIRSSTGSGLGIMLDAETVLTNWHVTRQDERPLVDFPAIHENIFETNEKALRGTVVKTDRAKDLALVKVEATPPRSTPAVFEARNPPSPGSVAYTLVSVGASWKLVETRAREIFPSHIWTDGKAVHYGTVIKIDAELPPGSSGGPLFTDEGKVAGIVSFKISSDGKGGGYALSAPDIHAFLSSPTCHAPALEYPQPPLQSGRTRDQKAFARSFASENGRLADVLFLYPDNPGAPYTCFMDSNNDGKADTWILDLNRDGRWDYTVFDSDFNGMPDKEAYNENGELVPQKSYPYKEQPLLSGYLTSFPEIETSD